MATLNPLCTNATIAQDSTGVIWASCGCGWVESGFPSKRKADREHKAHRFPPGSPPPPVRGESGRGGAARAVRRDGALRPAQPPT